MYLKYLLPLIRRNSILFARISPQRFMKQSSEPVTEDKDAPIKYSTSKAGQWKARYSSAGEHYDDTPKIQSFIMMMSLASILIYFCILREENDLDDYLRYAETNVPLVLQEAQLQIEIEQYKERHADTRHLESKLLAVREKKEKLRKSMLVD